MKNIYKTLIATGVIIVSSLGFGVTARATDFPEKGKVAATVEQTFTNKRKGGGTLNIPGKEVKLDFDFKSKETSGKLAYGLTDNIAPYLKVGAKDLKMEMSDEDGSESHNLGTGLVYGAGITARVKGLPYGLELRGAIGYESSENQKSFENEDGKYELTVSQDKIPASITAHKDFGNFSAGAGLAYEHLEGNFNVKADGLDQDVDYEGKDNLGVLLNVGYKPKENIELNAGYNSIGDSFLFGATIKF